MRTSSVGFLPWDWTDYDENGEEMKALMEKMGYGPKGKPELPRRLYTKQDLLELSLVPVPANPYAFANAAAKGILKEKELNMLKAKGATIQREVIDLRFVAGQRQPEKVVEVEGFGEQTAPVVAAPTVDTLANGECSECGVLCALPEDVGGVSTKTNLQLCVKCFKVQEQPPAADTKPVAPPELEIVEVLEPKADTPKPPPVDPPPPADPPVPPSVRTCILEYLRSQRWVLDGQENARDPRWVLVAPEVMEQMVAKEGAVVEWHESDVDPHKSSMAYVLLDTARNYALKHALSQLTDEQRAAMVVGKDAGAQIDWLSPPVLGPYLLALCGEELPSSALNTAGTTLHNRNLLRLEDAVQQLTQVLKVCKVPEEEDSAVELDLIALTSEERATLPPAVVTVMQRMAKLCTKSKEHLNDHGVTLRKMQDMATELPNMMTPQEMQKAADPVCPAMNTVTRLLKLAGKVGDHVEDHQDLHAAMTKAMGKLEALVKPEEGKALSPAVGVVVKKLKKLISKVGDHNGDHEDTHSILTASLTKLKEMMEADQDPDDTAPGEEKGTSADTTVPPEYDASYKQLMRGLKQGSDGVDTHHDTVTKMEVAGQALLPANEDEPQELPEDSTKPKPVPPSQQEFTLVLADPNVEEPPVLEVGAEPEVPEQMLTLAVEEEQPPAADPSTPAPDVQDSIVVNVDPEELRQMFREAAQETFGHLTGNVRSFVGRGRVLPKRQR